MDISSDKLVRLHMRRPGHNYNLKRETKSLLITAQNKAIRINYIKAKIDNMQQNSKCRLCGDKHEMVYHIKSKYNKLVQKENKTMYDWM